MILLTDYTYSYSSTEYQAGAVPTARTILVPYDKVMLSSGLTTTAPAATPPAAAAPGYLWWHSTTCSALFRGSDLACRYYSVLSSVQFFFFTKIFDF